MARKPPIKVLVVAPEEWVWDLFQETLECCKISVSFVSNGLEAQEAILQEEYDFLITDYQMPCLDGVELLRWVKATHSRVKVFFMAGNEEENVLSMARAAEADDIFRKPFDFDLLVSAIRIERTKTA